MRARFLVLGGLAVASSIGIACSSSDTFIPAVDAGSDADSPIVDAAPPVVDSAPIVIIIDGAAPSGDDDDSSASTNGDASNDAPTDSAVDMSGARVSGSISLYWANKVTADGPPAGSITVAFYAPPASSGTSTCTSTTVAAGCSLQVCTSAPAGGSPAVYANESAGNVSVTFAGGSPRVFPPQASDSGAYNAADGGGFIFSALTPGQAVSAVAAGDPLGIPAFSLSVLQPSKSTLTQPALTIYDGGVAPFAPYSTSFPRASDLTVAWTGGTAGTYNRVILKSTAKAAPYASKSLICDFDQATSPVTIPSANGLALLDMVDSAGTSYSGSLSITGTAGAFADAGNATIAEYFQVAPAQTITYSNTN